MRKLIGIAFSDLHCHKFKNFNQNNRRLNNCLWVIKELGNIAVEKSVPIFFAGDWYHTNEVVETETHGKAMTAYANTMKFCPAVYAISGNHDLSERNGINHKSPSHLESYDVAFPNFHLLDFKGFRDYNIMVAGIPYCDNDKDLLEMIEKHSEEARKYFREPGAPKILMLHSDLPGAKTPVGFEVEETEHIPKDLDKLFEDWDIVLCGHIHKPQILGKNCVMLGSPLHQDRGDEGTEMGYWEIWNGDGNFTLNFVPLNYPQFKTGEERGDGNYWVNQEVALVEENEEVGDFHVTNSRKKLASQYLKRKGIKDKQKKRALIEILNSAE